MRYLKQAARPLNEGDPAVGRRVAELLERLESDREAAATALAAEFDQWIGPVLADGETSGPNHILPTGRAARYSGGLNALRFTKQLTWQRLSAEAGRREAPVAAMISRYEGMEGHARSADLRGRQ